MSEFIGNTLIKLERVDSTNNYATAHMTINNWKEGTVVICEEQFQGRGQINNSWESEPHKNLAFSIVLYPKFLRAQDQFMLSKIVSLGIAETLDKLVDGVSIKWPNDIYVGHQKIGGILIENSIMGSTLFSTVIGIGINVNQKEFKSNAPNPVSLWQLLNRDVDLNELLLLLLESIERWYIKLKSGKMQYINLRFEQQLFKLNKVAEYKDSNGIYKGIILGVNEIGQLRIQDLDGGLRCYHFKEVEFL